MQQKFELTEGAPLTSGKEEGVIGPSIGQKEQEIFKSCRPEPGCTLSVLPKVDLDRALRFEPAQKGSQSYLSWREKSLARGKEDLKLDEYYHTKVEKGDSLWGIAERSIKTRCDKYTKADIQQEMQGIIEANKRCYPWLEKNPHFLKEGMKLQIPQLTKLDSFGSGESNERQEKKDLNSTEKSKPALRPNALLKGAETSQSFKSETLPGKLSSKFIIIPSLDDDFRK